MFVRHITIYHRIISHISKHNTKTCPNVKKSKETDPKKDKRNVTFEQQNNKQMFTGKKILKCMQLQYTICMHACFLQIKTS